MTYQSDHDPLAVSILAAGAYLGVGRSTVYNLLATGRLDSIRIGRRRLVTSRSIAHLVERSRVAPESETSAAEHPLGTNVRRTAGDRR